MRVDDDSTSPATKGFVTVLWRGAAVVVALGFLVYQVRRATAEPPPAFSSSKVSKVRVTATEVPLGLSLATQLATGSWNLREWLAPRYSGEPSESPPAGSGSSRGATLKAEAARLVGPLAVIYRENQDADTRRHLKVNGIVIDASGRAFVDSAVNDPMKIDQVKAQAVVEAWNAVMAAPGPRSPAGLSLQTPRPTPNVALPASLSLLATSPALSGTEARPAPPVVLGGSKSSRVSVFPAQDLGALFVRSGPDNIETLPRAKTTTGANNPAGLPLPTRTRINELSTWLSLKSGGRWLTEVDLGEPPPVVMSTSKSTIVTGPAQDAAALYWKSRRRVIAEQATKLVTPLLIPYLESQDATVRLALHDMGVVIDSNNYASINPAVNDPTQINVEKMHAVVDGWNSLAHPAGNRSP